MRALLRIFPAASATLIVALVVALLPLHPVARTIAMIAALLSWVATFAFVRPERRAHASTVVAIAAVVAAGQTSGGRPYAVACALFVVGSLVAMRDARTSFAPRDVRAPLPRRATVTLVVVAVATSATILAILPKVAVYVEYRVTRWLSGGGFSEEQTAFSTAMALGSTHRILLSDAVVLRIDGEPPGYLRGAVYDRYNGKYWTTAPVGRTRQPSPASAPPRQDDTIITLVRGAPNGDDMRWFVPSGACDVATYPGKVEVDGYGVYRRGDGVDPRTFRYRTRGCTTPPATAAPPAKEDLDVHERLLPVLGPLAARWTAGATTDRDRLDAMTRELARFEYSLAVERDPNADPVVDFLTLHRAGHCEMFASALALLARTQGIHTRVIGGYRVSEGNRLTGRAVVRDRNAHAWVEAWVDGAWRRWDPTPASESFGPRTSMLEQVSDALASLYESAVLRAEKLETTQILASLGGLIALLFAVRELTRRLARRRARRARHGESRPLPAFAALEDALAAAGYARDFAEPIEAYARRIGTLGTTWGASAATAILAYAAHRYGGQGTIAAVVADLERAAKATSSAPRR